MEVEELQQDLYSTFAMEWHHWQPEHDLEPKLMKAKAELNLKRLRDLDGFFQTRHEVENSVKHEKLLDLVIEQGMSVRQAGLSVGIAVRTAQHYVKLYKDDEEKRLP
ncbi:hypothetical protein A0J61_07328, partial [Choanephora cucurbitarum]